MSGIRCLGAPEVARLRVDWSEDGSIEALRACLMARRVCSRQRLVGDVIELLADVEPQDPQVLRELLAHMVRVGDASEGEGGQVAVTPVRAVILGSGRFKVVGTMPTAVLRAAVPGALVTGRVDREMVHPDEGQLTASLAEIGGRLFTAEAWVALDRAPFADGAWLKSLVSRAAVSELRDPRVDIEWRSYSPDAEKPQQWRRWVKTGAGPLWRADDLGGHKVFAWLDGASPGQQRYLHLAADEAARTAFALDDRDRAPLTFSLTKHVHDVSLKLDASLPRAEFRYLATLGDRQEDRIWRFTLEVWPTVARTLIERLRCQFTPLGGAP